MPDVQAIIADDLSEKIRPLSRKEFVQLAELGAFEDERVELLFGVLVPMSPQDVPHCTARPGETLRLVAFPDVEIAVSDVLGVAPAP